MFEGSQKTRIQKVPFMLNIELEFIWHFLYQILKNFNLSISNLQSLSNLSLCDLNILWKLSN